MRLLRQLSVFAIVALAPALPACGDDDAQDTGGGGGERASARAAVERLYDAMGDSDAEGVCEQLSKAGQRQIASGGLGTKSKSCVESFQGFFDEADEAGGLEMVPRAKVESVKVDGDRATARVSFGRRGSAGDVPLVKENGEWKLAAVGSSTP